MSITPTQLMEAPDGADGEAYREILKLMRDLTRSGKREPMLRDFACSLIQDCPSKHFRCEVNTLFDWVFNNIRYVQNTTDIQSLSDASGTIDRSWGSCADMSLLLATLLEATGHRTRFVALGRSYGNFEHVIVEVKNGQGWLPLDASEARPIGWSPTDMPFSMIMHNSG